MLQHRVYNGILTSEKDTLMVMQHLADLWGYEVMLSEVEAQTEHVLKQHTVSPTRGLLVA